MLRPVYLSVLNSGLNMPSLDSEESGELPEEPRDEQRDAKQREVAHNPANKAQSEDAKEKEQPAVERVNRFQLASKIHAQAGFLFVGWRQVHVVCRGPSQQVGCR